MKVSPAHCNRSGYIEPNRRPAANERRYSETSSSRLTDDDLCRDVARRSDAWLVLHSPLAGDGLMMHHLDLTGKNRHCIRRHNHLAVRPLDRRI